jgi:hypothetical protein
MRTSAALVLIGVVACSDSSSSSSGASSSCATDCAAHAIVEGGQVNAHAIAIAKDDVYWSTEPQGGKPNLLRRVASSGGQVSDVANDNGRFQMGSNGDALFFVLASKLVKLDAGVQTVLVPKLDGASVESIAANATHVYFANGEDIKRVPVGGGTPEIVYSTPQVARIVLDATNVYFAEGINNTLQTVAFDGPSPKTPRTLASQKDPMRFAIWSGAAYFASQRDKTIKSVAVTGGATPVLLAETDDEPLSIAADGSGIYYGSNKGLSRLPLAGGKPSPVNAPDTQSHMVLDIALDASHVYWIDYSYQAIFRAGK